MLSVIFWVVLNISTCLLLCFCYDKPRFRNGEVLDLDMPSIYDFASVEDRYTADRYVKEVICHAKHYFILNYDLNYEDSGSILIKLLVQSCSFIYIPISFDSFLDQFAFFQEHEFIAIICVSLLMALTVVLCFVAFFLYEFKCTIRPYSLSPKDIKDNFDYWYDRTERHEYPISRIRAYKNYVIESYYHYLLSIEKSINLRRILKHYLVCISIAIFVIFYIRNGFWML